MSFFVVHPLAAADRGRSQPIQRSADSWSFAVTVVLGHLKSQTVAQKLTI